MRHDAEKAPIVSVVLTSLNGATRGYLREAIESVLSQTYRNFDLIIVDDGSTDGTGNLCREYKDPRIRYYYQENKGLGAARNAGIEQSIGELVCFLDDDDVWFPEKLEKQVAFFNSCPDPLIGMVYTSLELIDETGRKCGHQANIADGQIYKRLLYGNIVDAPSSVMIKRQVFDEVGRFKQELFSSEDYEMWLRLSKVFHVYSLGEDLVKYRVHANKMSRNYRKMEYFRLIAVMLALLEADDEIQELESEIYGNLYQSYAQKHFSLENMRQFRKYFWVARSYAPVRLGLWARLALSYCPPLMKALKRQVMSRKAKLAQA